jgi:hypothetical protein
MKEGSRKRHGVLCGNHDAVPYHHPTTIKKLERTTLTSTPQARPIYDKPAFIIDQYIAGFLTYSQDIEVDTVYSCTAFTAEMEEYL